METYKWMIKDGDIYYSEPKNKYFLVIGANLSGIQPDLYLNDVWELLAYNDVYDSIKIVLVELLNNKYYKKSIQTQPLNELYVRNIRYGGEKIRYDRHINISKYKLDILKRKLIDDNFSPVKEVYFKRLMEVINYLSPCIDFLDKFQMYQNIIINANNINDSAVYLGMTNGNIRYYSRQQELLRVMEFEQFKIAVKPDKGCWDNKKKYLKHGEDIQELKDEIQRHKSLLKSFYGAE